MRYLLCGLMALALGGCASVNYAQKHADAGHYNYNPNDSMALNVARATGLTECDEDGCAPLRDVPREKLPASLQGKTDLELASSVMDALTLGQGVGQIAGVASVVTGVGNLAGGLLTLGSFFTGPVSMDNPATKGWIIAWMPKSIANTEELARAEMVSLIKNALPRTFNSYSFKFADQTDENFLRVMFYGGNACGKPHYYCQLDIFFHLPTTVMASPSWANNGPAYVWQNWKLDQSSNGSFYFIDVEFRRYPVNGEGGDVAMPKDLDPRAYLAELSKKLPSWAYIYLPPTERHDYPAMLNQGKLLLFVEPKTTVTGASKAD